MINLANKCVLVRTHEEYENILKFYIELMSVSWGVRPHSPNMTNMSVSHRKKIMGAKKFDTSNRNGDLT